MSKGRTLDEDRQVAEMDVCTYVCITNGHCLIDCQQLPHPSYISLPLKPHFTTSRASIFLSQQHKRAAKGHNKPNKGHLSHSSRARHGLRRRRRTRRTAGARRSRTARAARERIVSAGHVRLRSRMARRALHAKRGVVVERHVRHLLPEYGIISRHGNGVPEPAICRLVGELEGDVAAVADHISGIDLADGDIYAGRRGMGGKVRYNVVAQVLLAEGIVGLS